MKSITKVVCIGLLGVLLAGCGERFSEIKDAASGINSAADSAAKAISKDVHTVREITIDYNEASFTINDLFKSILRDVRWKYEADKKQLQVEGTWQDPLFISQQWDDSYKKELAENGRVTITLHIDDKAIDGQKTKVQLKLHDKIIIEDEGDRALHHLYDTYLSK